VKEAVSLQRRPATYVVRWLKDRELIRSLLLAHQAYGALAMAHLSPRLFPRSRYFLAQGEEGWALLFYAHSEPTPLTLTLGDEGPLEALLRLHPGPRWTFLSLQTHHLAVAQRHFSLSQQHLMLRMRVDAESFTPPPPVPKVEVMRLSGRDVAAINRLYSAEGSATSYPPSVIDEGIYYGGMWDGKLVAIAGTHVVAPEEGVAVVGNVFTHPRFRGRGLATLVTGAVTRHLLDMCPQVYLTVDSQNLPAIAAYRRLGYHVECTLYETPALRRDLVGLLPLVRRLIARRRGGDQGAEIVIL
jgi:RimJ/RimL family protein N-acetyltransferase